MDAAVRRDGRDKVAPVVQPEDLIRRRWIRRLVGAALVVFDAAITLFFVATYTGGRATWGIYKLDLGVYRLGSAAWLHGTNLYGNLPPTAAGITLPFTYPPLAAIVLAPLDLVSLRAASAILTATTVVLLGAVLYVVVAAAGVPRRLRPWLVLAVLPAAMLLEPVRSTLGYGQINVALMAMVTADCLTPHPKWPRGALIGVAAAIKLTPAVFVVYLLARRDVRAAATAAVAAVVATGAAFAAAPSDSWRYWTSIVFDTKRVGNPGYTSNQSILGVLYRFGLSGALRTALWIVLVAVLVGVATALARRSSTRGRDALGLTFVAVAGLLVSPISWTHHWVWIAPLLLLLGIEGVQERRWAALATATALAAVYFVGPPWLVPKLLWQGRGWSVLQQVYGNAYTWAALGLLVVAGMSTQLWAVARRGRQATAPVAAGDPVLSGAPPS